MLSWSEANGALPGFKSLAIGDRDAVHAQQLDRRQLRFAQVRVGTRQQDGNRACGSHRVHAFLVEVLEMVGGERLVFRSKRRALLVGELLGMELDGEAELLGLDEDALDLRGREADVVAVRVDGVGESLGRSGGQDLLAYTFNIVVAAALELGRHGMGREERGADGQREALAERARDAKDLELVVEVEPVAGLDLERGHALGDEFRGPCKCKRQEIAFACGACRGDGRCDAAAGLRDVLVARARQPLLELAVARAGPDEVRVAVDEPGRHQCAARVGVRDVLRQLSRQFLARTHPCDAIAGERDCALRDQSVGTPVDAGRDGCVSNEPGPPGRVEECHGRRAYRKPLGPRYAACLIVPAGVGVPESTITREFVAELPKTDLHVHLDGSLRIPTLIDLARASHVELPSYTEGGLRETVYKERYTSLGDYLKGFRYTVGVMQNEEALERVAAGAGRGQPGRRACAISRSGSRHSCTCARASTRSR